MFMFLLQDERHTAFGAGTENVVLDFAGQCLGPLIDDFDFTRLFVRSSLSLSDESARNRNDLVNAS